MSGGNKRKKIGQACLKLISLNTKLTPRGSLSWNDLKKLGRLITTSNRLRRQINKQKPAQFFGFVRPQFFRGQCVASLITQITNYAHRSTIQGWLLSSGDNASSEITKIKGKKRVKNQPALHDEVKTSKHLSLTPSSWDKLKKIADDRGISVSEVIERWVRNIEGD